MLPYCGLFAVKTAGYVSRAIFTKKLFSTEKYAKICAFYLREPPRVIPEWFKRLRAEAKQGKSERKRSLPGINEFFEQAFNEVLASAVILR